MRRCNLEIRISGHRDFHFQSLKEEASLTWVSNIYIYVSFNETFSVLKGGIMTRPPSQLQCLRMTPYPLQSFPLYIAIIRLHILATTLS
jgi:hypothetical protein